MMVVMMKGGVQTMLVSDMDYGCVGDSFSPCVFPDTLHFVPTIPSPTQWVMAVYWAGAAEQPGQYKVVL